MEVTVRFRKLLLVVAVFLAACIQTHCADAAPKTRNVVILMADGLRWQEVFQGADPDLLNKENGGVNDVPALKAQYWRTTPEERRATLMPFLWGVVRLNGQIFGNYAEGSEVAVTNGLNFSYPGYSETLCGFVDTGVNSNDKIPNPNITVLEWLNGRPSLHTKVAAFGAWDVIPSIVNEKRCGFQVNGGYDPLPAPRTPTIAMLNRLKSDLPKHWGGEPYDALTFNTALEYLKVRKPRVLFISLGETDEWAHEGDYAEYLRSAQRHDNYANLLWETLQSMPEYRDRTTLVLTTDHGRGEAPTGWRGHGTSLPGSKRTWLAVMGPDTPAQGEQKAVPAVTQTQIAATVAALLGEDYRAAQPKAGKPLAAVLGK